MKKHFTSLGVSALLLGLLASQPVAAQRQAFQSETFTGPYSPLFSGGGVATLTGNGGTDPNGQGYLRLTSAQNDQAGNVIGNNTFPSTLGFSISFEFFAYGGNGPNGPADGFSMFLVDGDKTSVNTFQPGASGGSLGYAQKTEAPTSPGVPFGYIGIGIDEFGNYSFDREGRVGGRGFTPDAVAIRGPGNGSDYPNYAYLGGTGTLPYSIDVATPRAQQGSDDYRRAFVDVVPQDNAYKITVRLQHGNAIETVISNFVVTAPPPNLRIGFAGSTGQGTNIHELRNLVVAQAPLLADDGATLRAGRTVNMSVLANDRFLYANYQPGTLDLDITQAGIQSTVTKAGEGTYSATSDGVVSFTSATAYNGTSILPYTAQDQLGQTGAPANLVMTVDRNAPLPVSLVGFKAVAVGRMAQVSWATASELNNAGFIVERSTDGASFTPLDTLAGRGTTSQVAAYLYIDSTAADHVGPSKALYYRLCQLDLDGAKTYSPVQAISFTGRVTPKASLYPNPAGDETTLSLRELPSGDYNVTIYDLAGRVIESHVAQGGEQHKLDLHAYKPGSYIVRLVGAVNQSFFFQRL
jgi:hypothetical protein